MQTKSSSVRERTFLPARTLRASRCPRNTYPVVDLFAGPGGLGEGFASLLDCRGRRKFATAIAIERDEFSYQTLLLRHFLRCFPEGEIPDDYYAFLSGRISRADLFRQYPTEQQEAHRSALQISLGPESHTLVRNQVRDRLDGCERWALVGGPPCQAYSLVGRSRMMNGPEFEKDERHTLYLEYLRIVADHRPPVFVMENVKGLLSATIDGKSTVTRIVRDLAHPGSAFRSGPKDLSYRLYSLSDEGCVEGDIDPRQFVVRAEDYGIPQARHRIFIVGIRNDLKIRPATLRRMKPPTVREAIGTLPNLRSSLSRGTDSLTAWRAEIRQISRMNIREQLNCADYAPALAGRVGVRALSNLSLWRLVVSRHCASPLRELARGADTTYANWNQFFNAVELAKQEMPEGRKLADFMALLKKYEAPGGTQQHLPEPRTEWIIRDLKFTILQELGPDEPKQP